MTQAVTCPGCNQQIAIDDSPQQMELERLKQEMNRPRTHEEISRTIPKGVNFGSCPDGNCEKKIENPNKTTKFYDCPHCDANTVPSKYSNFCPTCGKNLKDEDLNESSVDISNDKGWW
ncbi:MAG: hypothetical protein IIA82_09640 [Thaumarchaeota archaeon]|nr:hypothetical protein [Nitrososphaerota archaeon]